MKKTENINEFLPLTAEEIKKLNLSQEELDILADAEGYTQTLDLLPENIDPILDRIDKEFPNGKDFDGTFKRLAELAEKDPKFYAQVLALSTIVGDCKEVKNTTTKIKK